MIKNSAFLLRQTERTVHFPIAHNASISPSERAPKINAKRTGSIIGFAWKGNMIESQLQIFVKFDYFSNYSSLKSKTNKRKSNLVFLLSVAQRGRGD